MSKLNQQAQSVNIEFPDVRPILDLRFALAKKLDPRITFTRGTSGTYVGPDGLIKTASANEPRFEHDPITGECKGLLMEQGRTNILLNSNGFNSWDYQDNITLVANSTVSPDGTLNAYKQIESAGYAIHRNTQLIYSPTLISARTYTFSIFIKQPENITAKNIEFGFYVDSGGGVDTFINWADFIANGRITNSPAPLGSSSVVTYGVISYPNNWYRFYVSATVPAYNAIYPFCGSWDDYKGNTYTGDGTTGFYVYGAQLEQGTYLTSYIPTTSSSVSRGGDLAVIQGTNFSSWFGDTSPQELSVFFSGYCPDGVIGRNPNSGLNYWRLSNVGRSEIIEHQYAGLPQFILKKNGATTNAVFTASTDLLNIKSMCLMNSKKIRIILNEFFPDYVFSKTQVVALPTGVTRFAIGGAEDFDGAQINGTVERLAIYSKELSLNQAQSFTL